MVFTFGYGIVSKNHLYSNNKLCHNIYTESSETFYKPYKSRELFTYMTNKPLDTKKHLPPISAALDKAITDELNQKISILSDEPKDK